jgi:hypothetical protein
MQKELVIRGRMKYIELNRKFLQEVENGTSWEELQPLLEEMKSLAIHLHYIPVATVATETPSAASEAAAEPSEA